MGSELFQPLAFALQRNGDWSGMERVYASAVTFLKGREDIGERTRTAAIQSLTLVRNLWMAAQDGDAEACAEKAKEVLKVTGGNLPVPISKLYERLAGNTAADVVPLLKEFSGLVLSDLPDAGLMNGYAEIAQAVQLCAQRDPRAILTLLVAALRRDATSNHWTAWRARHLLAILFEYNDSPLLGALFGKLAVRTLEHTRLEAAAHGK